MTIPFVIVDERKITLENNRVIVYRDELVCYHKRDYDWVEKSSATFSNEREAKFMFDLISDAERSGQRKAKIALTPRFDSVIRDFKQNVELLLK